MRVEDGRFRGLEVYVELEDGSRLNEYPGPVDTAYSQIGQREVTTTVCCYLECPADRSKSFKICFGGTIQASSDFVSDTYMDGQMIDGVVNYPDQLPPTVSHVYQTAGNVGYQYPLKFGKLETTEDAANALSNALSMSAGRIEVVFRIGSCDGPSYVDKRKSVTFEQKPIHEKAKKAALDSSIQLGENSCVAETTIDNQPFTYTRPNLLDLVVIFLYRGRELLIAQDIIEPPARQSVDNDEDRSPIRSDTAATLRAVKQEAQALRERVRELEGGNGASGSSHAGGRRKRTEVTSSADKRQRTGDKGIIDARQAEVIDLSFDSD